MSNEVVSFQCYSRSVQNEIITKEVLPGVLVRLLLFVTDPISACGTESERERERGEEESKERGAARRETMRADKETEAHQREGKKVSVANEREPQMEERAVIVLLSHSTAMH